ncbi:MAG: hypothetical protein KJ941_04195 [Bacteroidetes bacterium]|nr:hypothetical protein [Bacteroidota bacterium]
MPKRKAKPRPRKKKASNRWLIISVAVVISCALLFWVFKKEKVARNKIVKSEFVLNIPEGFASSGIDVSHHQRKIDWNLLFNQLRYDTLIRFVYCKATESLSHVDTRWEINRAELNGLGIMNGAYHFFDPMARPREQATHFLTHWKPREIDLPPVLDVENEGFSDDDLIAKMKIWLSEVEMQTGYRPLIYTSLSFYETKFKNKFPGYYFWIAAYSQRPVALTDSQVLHWQYSETGKLPGFKELVDLNVSKVGF